MNKYKYPIGTPHQDQMADFIMLVVAYMMVFLLMSYILLLGDSNFHRHGVIGKLRSAFVQITAFIIYACFPRKLQTFMSSITSYLFYKRNHYIQALYIVIFAGVLWVFTTQVHPGIRALHLSTAHQIAPYVIMATNFAIFITCCLSDPGVITKENYNTYARVFKFDGVFYKAGVKCRTCNFVKPARSKHCAFCDHCVYRFDHHCSWVNNCIGGRNARYFILLLVTITLATFYLSYITGRVLQGVAVQSGIWQAGYIGTDRQYHPVNARIVFQHMFMQLPAMVFLMTSLLLLGILMTAFLPYHLFLLASNQTTNERYKRSKVTLEVGRSQGPTTSFKGKTSKGNINKEEQSRLQNQSRDCPSSRWHYDLGIWGNLCEVISPL